MAVLVFSWAYRAADGRRHDFTFLNQGTFFLKCTRNQARDQTRVSKEPAGLDFEPAGLDFEPAGLELKPVGLELEPAGLEFGPKLA